MTKGGDMEDTMEYGKKSMGQWVSIYLVIGLLVYGGFYYFAMGKKGTGGYGGEVSQSPKPLASETASMTTKYLTDSEGMSLYTFDEDAAGVSSCYDKCAVNWPPYMAGEVMAEGLTTITRKDGSKQYVKEGMPLYYYKDDTKAGDITGDGVNGTWHLAK